jgi:hypothetical protein
MPSNVSYYHTHLLTFNEDDMLEFLVRFVCLCVCMAGVHSDWFLGCTLSPFPTAMVTSPAKNRFPKESGRGQEEVGGQDI